jgi:hypothetical protein
MVKMISLPLIRLLRTMQALNDGILLSMLLQGMFSKHLRGQSLLLRHMGGHRCGMNWWNRCGLFYRNICTDITGNCSKKSKRIKLLLMFW